MIARRVGDDAQEPRAEAAARVDGRDRPPRPLARHLHDVVGVGRITEHHGGEAQRASPMTGDEPAIGTGIARQGLPEEFCIIVLDTSVLLDRLGAQRASR